MILKFRRFDDEHQSVIEGTRYEVHVEDEGRTKIVQVHSGSEIVGEHQLSAMEEDFNECYVMDRGETVDVIRP